MILAGDVGGTKTRLALYEKKDDSLVRHETETFLSGEHAGLEDVVNSFLAKHNVTIEAACFGVPGPVINGSAQTANLRWSLSEKHITEKTSLPKVKFVNDLVATAAAVPFLPQEDVLVLHEGKKPKQDRVLSAVLAPGTGCGQAFLYFESGRYHIHASEGGHVDFAPNTEVEMALLRYLKAKFGHISYERILCGPGLMNIYSFLKDTGYAPEPPELRRRIEEEDPAAVIATTGQEGEYEICVQALDIFASVLGAQAGNLVLTLLATGGIYLGGGIPPKIVQKLSDGTTVAAYLRKGRLSNLVADTSLYMIKDECTALLGAARLATR